ncbi:MAG: hypothetical protein Q9182_005616 [Xanthomendoza sp. 2 TL-2023]
MNGFSPLSSACLFPLLFLLALHLPKFVEAIAVLPRAGGHSSQQSRIRWTNCSASDKPGIQCGFISVPLDYKNKELGVVELAMVRLSPPRPARLGTLFFNPGGPGVAASTYVLAAAQGPPYFGQTVLDYYEIIGLDPRGVGMSHPIKCDPSLYNERVSSFPTTDEDFKSLVDHNRALGKSCVELTGPLINNLDTMNLGRDMELVRQALNAHEKLNFLGQSYGSQVGLTYAELFPRNVKRMVLDGIVDHTQDETTLLNDEGTAYETTIIQFFAWCNTTANCTLRGQDIAGVYESVVRTAEEHPIPAPGCTSSGDSACRADVTAEEIRTNLQSLILFQTTTISEAGWDKAAEAIAQAAHGNATLLSSPLATSEDDGAFSGLAIGCQDWRHGATSLADLRYKISMASATAPHTRGSSQTYLYQSNCIGWPAPTSNPQRRLRPKIAEAPPILLVNSLYDPSTSIIWATGIQSQVKDSVLLTRLGNGHTSYQLRGEAANAIDAFLVKGILPQPASVVHS